MPWWLGEEWWRGDHAMTITRRNLLKTGSAGLAAATLAGAAGPTLGLIFPVPRPVPEEALAMYPSGVKFIVTDVGLKTMTPEGYEAVIDRIPDAGGKLTAGGAN